MVIQPFFYLPMAPYPFQCCSPLSLHLHPSLSYHESFQLYSLTMERLGRRKGHEASAVAVYSHTELPSGRSSWPINALCVLSSPESISAFPGSVNGNCFPSSKTATFKLTMWGKGNHKYELLFRQQTAVAVFLLAFGDPYATV